MKCSYPLCNAQFLSFSDQWKHILQHCFQCKKCTSKDIYLRYHETNYIQNSTFQHDCQYCDDLFYLTDWWLHVSHHCRTCKKYIPIDSLFENHEHSHINALFGLYVEMCPFH